LCRVVLSTPFPQAELIQPPTSIFDSAAFFTIFTIMMTATQLQLLSTALTTIESYSIASQRDRERAALARQFGFCGYRDKVKTRKRWEREWGKIATEGNRWWIGGSGREIRQTMGDDPLGWICEWSGSGWHGALRQSD
jgi:palmitoyltransferase